MRRLTITAAIALGMAIAWGGCTRPNPTYCDLRTPCADAKRSYCDLTGQYGLKNLCVTEEQAKLAEQQICRSITDCNGPRPLCSETSFVCTGCRVDAECQSLFRDRPFCLSTLGTCNACRTNSDCPSAASFCNQGSCASCTSDEQCPSLLCHLGSCVLEEEIVYVAREGCTPAGMGSQKDPRCLPSEALPLLSQTRRFILVKASAEPYIDRVVIDENGPIPDEIVIVGQRSERTAAIRSRLPTGDPSAPIGVLRVASPRHVFLRRLDLMAYPSASAPSGIGLTAEEQGRVTVEDCRFEGFLTGISARASTIFAKRATVSDGSRGVYVDRSATATLESCLVRGNQQGLVVSADGRAVIHTSEIADNAIAGITALTGASLELEQSIIRGNGGATSIASSTRSGGLIITGADYIVRSSVIAKNVPHSTPGGSGVFLSGAGRMGKQTFINNTVVDNVRSPGAAEVECDTPVTIRNSILWNDTGIGFYGACRFEHSNVKNLSPNAGAGNLVSPPRFLDPGHDNFHLDVSSPLIDRGQADLAASTDLDGEPRLRGQAIDIGADEAR